MPAKCLECGLETADDITPLNCTICHAVFHPNCVEVNEDGSIKTCRRCNVNKGSTLALEANVLLAPKNNRRKAISLRSASSRSSKSSKAVQKDLELLETRRKLELQAQEQLQREREKYFEEKQEFIKTKLANDLKYAMEKSSLEKELETCNEDFENASVTSSQIAREKVLRWRAEQAKQLSGLDKTVVELPIDLSNNVRLDPQSVNIPEETFQPPKVSSTVNHEQAQPNVNLTYVERAPTHVQNMKQLAVNYDKNPDPQASYKPRMKCLSKEVLAARTSDMKNLSPFSGLAKEWPIFIRQFEQSTELCEFTDVENIVRLRNCLKGNARKAVLSALSYPENVGHIITVLSQLFGRPEFILNELIQDVRQLTSVKLEKFDDVIHFSILVSNICITMKSAKMSDHLWNPLLLQELVCKLPTQMKREWAQYRNPLPSVNLETFNFWISQRSQEYSCLLTEPPSFNEPKVKKNIVNLHEVRGCIICDGTCSNVGSCAKFEKMSYKDKWVLTKSLHLCRMCLKPHKGKCTVEKACGLNDCPYKHHPRLHKPNSEEQSVQIPAIVNSHSSHSSPGVLFKILPVTLQHNNNIVNTYALLDDGSSITLVEQWVANALNIEGVPDELCLKWTGDTHKIEKESKRISFTITGGHQLFTLNNARTVRNLNLPRQSISSQSLAKEFSHLKNIPVASFENQQPSLLIGLDNVTLITSLKLREGSSGQPVAVKTRLGWVIFGGSSSSEDLQTYHVCECQNNLDLDMNHTLKNFIALENLLTEQPSKALLSVEDERALQIMDSTLKFLGDRYEIGLIWKFDDFAVPPSYPMAYRRLTCLEKMLCKDPALRQNLNEQMNDYVNQGFAQKLEKEDIKAATPSWYLPIFAVRNPNKPTKIRIVWDAASKVNNISLNSLLLKGPDQLTNLPGVLFRFRQFQVALAGDIKQMFHQVVIRNEDRPFLRFLWRNAPDSEVEVYQMNVMVFGASCSPSCSQFVKNVNAERFSEEMPLAVEAIKNNHYVDDWLQSVEGDQEAVNLANQVINIHNKGGFEIRNFLSNSSFVMNNLTSVNSLTSKMFQEDGDISEKLLGMWWEIKSDTFIYSLKYHKVDGTILQGEKIPTKREVLKLLMSIFDPLGLIAHLLIYPKIYMQEVWKSGIGWDEQVPANLHTKWITWIRLLPKFVENIQIPRWYGLSSSEKVELHVFVDASRDAFAAVAYLRFCCGDEVRCSLVSAKTKVAPLRLLSIPRLELSAAVLGCRLAQNVMTHHSVSFSRVTFWTDSKTVWCWLNSDHRIYKPFVAFRVAEILETSESGQWRWLPSNQNIADKATRQAIPTNDENEEWFAGPKFLHSLQEENWPVSLNKSEKTEEELRSHVLHHMEVSALPIDVTRFSKWRRLIGCLAYVRRFVFNCKALKLKTPIFDGPLNKKEISRAEIDCFKLVQANSFIDEIAELSKDQTISRKSPLYKLNVFLDSEGLLRSSSRLTWMVNAHEDFINPIILPNCHYVVKLLLQSYHEKFHHQNHDTVLHEIQQRFSITSLRTALKKIRSACQFCKNAVAAPAVPVMANLPKARLTPFTQPFTYIGIDYFGPYFVAVGRNRSKRWGVLITCLNTRAVHLDICESLSTDSCICAIKRFMSRRGQPLEIYSDQGTNFKGTHNELRDAVLNLDQQKLASEFTTSSMQWNFNPPLAPHMGGVWERLVRSVKMALSYALSNSTRTPREELLRTMICEAEFIVNSRPLTYIPLDSETAEVLTPNHFIMGSSNGVRSFGTNTNDATVLSENWKRSNQLINHFWKRWIREYLPIIRRRSKWFVDVRELEVGDIVVMVEDNYEKHLWRKAKVLEVTKSRDGHVRKATVQTASQNIYERAAAKLAILDVRKDCNGNTSIIEIDALPGGSVESHTAANNLSK